MVDPVFLRGERVVLRPIDTDDVQFIHEGVNHPKVRPYVGQSFPTTKAGEREYIEEMDARDDAMQVLATADGDRVGVIEFDPIDRDDGVADLGFWIHPDKRSNGYAQDAVELVVAHAFDELRLHKVTANAYEGNKPSRHLLERVGFSHEGTGREDAFFGGTYHDTHYYGLLGSEFEA